MHYDPLLEEQHSRLITVVLTKQRRDSLVLDKSSPSAYG